MRIGETRRNLHRYSLLSISATMTTLTADTAYILLLKSTYSYCQYIRTNLTFEEISLISTFNINNTRYTRAFVYVLTTNRK